MDGKTLEQVKKNMMYRELHLSKYATKSNDAIRLKGKIDDMRPEFFHDIDKIIYSLSYNRYIDKTQVFSNIDNDHISKRMAHVQLVSKIARTIGRALNLNEDLIEAIALGHDLGHVPFGHEGEYILNRISKECGEGYFNHNVQSVRTLFYIENKGLGNNISLQTLDGIMAHNGEIVDDIYEPVAKTKEEFFNEYNKTYIEENACKKIKPMTLEGCVVRLSDIIGYIGRDIEDAIILGRLDRNSIPKAITDVLGNNNRDIVNTIVLDIIENSLDKPYIKMSTKVRIALTDLKKFNYENIYKKANTKEELANFEKMFRTLFKKYVEDLETENKNSDIYQAFLNNMDNSYLNNNTINRIVIDYIAGMTDDYFIKRYNLLK